MAEAMEFAAGDDVEAAAGVSQQFENREVRVCFDGVTYRVRDGAKGAGEAAVGFEDADAAVNVSGCAGFFGDAGERDVFTLESP